MVESSIIWRVGRPIIRHQTLVDGRPLCVSPQNPSTPLRDKRLDFGDSRLPDGLGVLKKETLWSLCLVKETGKPFWMCVETLLHSMIVSRIYTWQVICTPPTPRSRSYMSATLFLQRTRASVAAEQWTDCKFQSEPRCCKALVCAFLRPPARRVAGRRYDLVFCSACGHQPARKWSEVLWMRKGAIWVPWHSRSKVYVCVCVCVCVSNCIILQEGLYYHSV